MASILRRSSYISACKVNDLFGKTIKNLNVFYGPGSPAEYKKAEKNIFGPFQNKNAFFMLPWAPYRSIFTNFAP